MRFPRILLVLSLVLAVGSASAAAPSAVGANPACAHAMADHDRDCGACDVRSAACSPAGCTQPAVTEARGASLERLDVGCPTIYAAAPLSSLALPPETAPPKHPIL